MFIRSLGVLLLATMALLIASSTASAQAVVKKANLPKITVAQADETVVQLANDVFGSCVQSKNTHLDRTEFHKSQDLLGTAMVAWAKNGKLMQIFKSGWKPTNTAAPNDAAADVSSTSSTGLVDIDKIEKERKVTLPEFTDYTRYWVNKAMQELAATPKVKAAHPVPAVRVPVVRREVIVKKVIKQTPPKPPVVKNTANTTK